MELLRRRLRESPADVGRMHILWALDGLGSLAEDDLLAALEDASPRVRDHAVRLAAHRLAARDRNRQATIAARGATTMPGVRLQVAFALGEWADARATAALATIAARDVADHWMRTAVLSSCATRSGDLLVELAKDRRWPKEPQAAQWFESLAAIAGARHDNAEVQQVLDVAAALPATSPLRHTLVLGLGHGLQRSGGNLAKARAAASAATAGLLTEMMDQAANTVADADAPLADRLQAAELLGYSGGEHVTEALLPLVDPAQPETLQLFALRTLGTQSQAKIAERLIDVWPRSTPKVQEEMIAVLTSRPAWAARLLDACESGQVAPGQIFGAASRGAGGSPR